LDADQHLKSGSVAQPRDGDTASAYRTTLGRRRAIAAQRDVTGREAETVRKGSLEFFKPIQDQYGKPMISSGCFSAYRTAQLREVGGWSNRTMAEDMDLTWTFYREGWKVRFVPEAVCYPIEPHDLRLLRKQLRRWSHGFVQNVMLHRRDLLRLG
jgi:cellulose synthase/poly-beta-1,6-N-acetylglucosamine synthase-like glycosyltransferase